tara:strand:+ start:68 stop:1717 length:1650 start_codon:yes stop_codon:yes gene_type:complete
MFELIIFSILAVTIITPCGYIFTKHNNNSIINLSNDLIYGLILISFITLLLNFFFPLNIIVNSLILLLPLFIVFKNLKIYYSFNFLKFLVFNLIIIFLLIAKSNIYRPDAILYHLPYTGILNNEKIIFGLSNLHFRFAHISIIQYFSAFFNNFIFGSKGIIFSIAIIASAVIINFLAHLICYLKYKKFNFHFFYLFSILIFIAYKMNRYGEYGNDAPTHFLFFFLISEIILTFNSKKIYFNANNLILAVFIILNKITMAFAIFLPFIFLKKNELFKVLLIPKSYFAFIFLFLWILKNMVISGCAIYPISKLCLQNLEWTNIDQTISVSQENEAWTKAWPDFVNINNISQAEYSKKFNWVSTWNSTHLKKINKILLPYFMLLVFIYLFIYFKFKEKQIIQNDIHNNKYLILIILMVIFSIIWFLKVPVYRYGYSYFVSFLALGFAYMCTFNNSIKKNAYRFFIFFLILLTTGFTLKNLLRIVKPENLNYISFFPKIIYTNKSDINKIESNNFIYYESVKMCGYSYAPCTHYLDQKLKFKKYYNYKVILTY